MSRGRAKAKNTRLARDIKYYSPNTDYEELSQELFGDSSGEASAEPVDQGQDDELAAYAAWVEESLNKDN